MLTYPLGKMRALYQKQKNCIHIHKAETFPSGMKTYYLAYRVPLHVPTQFDLSFAQEVANSCVFLKAPAAEGNINSATMKEKRQITRKEAKRPTFSFGRLALVCCNL